MQGMPELPRLAHELTMKEEFKKGFQAAIDALRFESGKCNCYDKVDSCAACQHRRSAEWLIGRKEKVLSGNG